MIPWQIHPFGHQGRVEIVALVMPWQIHPSGHQAKVVGPSVAFAKLGALSHVCPFRHLGLPLLIYIVTLNFFF